MPGVTLQAENIILGAKVSITLDAGAQVLALALPGDTGQATFISPGTLTIGANAVVHASNAVNLQTAEHLPRSHGDPQGRPQLPQSAGKRDHFLRPEPRPPAVRLWPLPHRRANGITSAAVFRQYYADQLIRLSL